jgi:hypothetical protein
VVPVALAVVQHVADTICVESGDAGQFFAALKNQKAYASTFLVAFKVTLSD